MTMKTYARALTAMVLVTTAACTGSSPAGPAPSPQAASAIIVGGESGAVVGVPVQLGVAVTLSDGTTQTPAVGVLWTSSDTGVAAIDANGVLTPRAGGTTTVGALVNGVAAVSTFNVYPNVAGTWNIALPDTGRFYSADTLATVTQTGNALRGNWRLNYLGLPFEGTITVDGDISLTGRLCDYVSTTYGASLYEVRDWRMSATAPGRYNGTMEFRDTRYTRDPTCTIEPGFVEVQRFEAAIGVR